MAAEDSDLPRSALAAAACAACTPAILARQPDTASPESAILAARTDGANWLTTAAPMTSSASARSTQINAGNVGQLGLAWYADLDTSRGQEATPLVIDGVIYVTTAWSMVNAYDARTGAAAVALRSARCRARRPSKACCDVGQPRRRRVERQGLSSARSTAG